MTVSVLGAMLPTIILGDKAQFRHTDARDFPEEKPLSEDTALGRSHF